jgi:predicted RNA-binding protein (virulence factor B family)
MKLPQMREGQVARVRVINVTKDGAFVDVGAERGIFMPYAGMRGAIKTGDKVWVKLYRDKSGRFAVTMKVEDELRRAARPAANVQVGDEINGVVYNFNEQGAFIFTDERYIAFLHNDEMVTKPLIGQEITVRITYLREDGRLNVSMRPLKQDAITLDAGKILELLKARDGKMPYSDDTSPEIIKTKFGISKAAFKRALGKLIKNKQVKQHEGWTYLFDDGQNQE